MCANFRIPKLSLCFSKSEIEQQICLSEEKGIKGTRLFQLLRTTIGSEFIMYLWRADHSNTEVDEYIILF